MAGLLAMGAALSGVLLQLRAAALVVADLLAVGAAPGRPLGAPSLVVAALLAMGAALR
jgi:hypothetical protein